MAKKVKLYNKGLREWEIQDSSKEMNKSYPGKSIEIDEKTAEKFVKNYPKDFLIGGEAPVKNNLRALNTKIEKLEKENAELKTQVEEGANTEELDKQIKELTEKVTALEAENAELKKAE